LVWEWLAGTWKAAAQAAGNQYVSTAFKDREGITKWTGNLFGRWNEKLREIRESKGLSQGDIEKCTGLLRGYTSGVENGYSVPVIEPLEKYARALEVPLYRCPISRSGR